MSLLIYNKSKRNKNIYRKKEAKEARSRCVLIYVLFSYSSACSG